MSGEPYSFESFRSNTWHFLTGRVASGGLSFCILLLLVRVLPLDQYGAYVAFTAVMELVLSLSGLGLPWVVSRYLPEFRLQAAADRCRWLIWRSTAWVLAVLVLVCAVLVGLAPTLLQGGHLQPFTFEFQLYALLAVLEGVSRHFREGVLGALMQQAQARAGLVLRQLLFLSALVAQHFSHGLSLRAVVVGELVACAVALLLTGWHMRTMLQALASWVAHDTPVSQLGFAAMWRTGAQMFAAHLLSMPYQPASLLLLLQRYSGLEAAALFGFVRSVYEQLCRYLPTALLFALIKPKLVAAAVNGASPAQLLGNAAFITRLSLFFTMPLLAFMGVAGPGALWALAGGRLHEASPVLLAMTVLVVVYGQRQLLEVCAVALNASRACLGAAVLSLSALLVAALAFQCGLAVWACILTLAAGQVAFTAGLQHLLGARLVGPAAWQADAKIMLGGAVAALLALAVGPLATGLPALALQLAICCLVALPLAWMLRPFTLAERDRLNAFIGRRVFP